MKKSITKIFAVLLVVVTILGTSSIAFADAAPETQESAVFVDHLYESNSDARGNSAPSNTKVKAMPYLATADIKNSVFTNYCVKPNTTSLKIQFDGNVNADTPGTARVQLLIYNARTGLQVASRNTSISNTFDNTWTITQLIKNDPYYVKVLITNKSNDDVRVTFSMWLKNVS